MGDLRKGSDDNVVALVEALLGRKIAPQEARAAQDGTNDYDHLFDVGRGLSLDDPQGIRPDSPPKDVFVGAANPFAVAEALLGRQVDRHSMRSARILQNVLQTDYDEMFDMKNCSVLYAGLKLNDKERRAERYDERDMKILNERDLITPDLSGVRRLEDLEKVGLKDIKDARVKVARMQNGKLRLVLEANAIGRRVTNRGITMSINELITPFRREDNQRRWTPPNAAWLDISEDVFQRVHRQLLADATRFQIGHGHNGQRRDMIRSFDDPTQGAGSNSWFVAALFSVYWADPSVINRATHLHPDRENREKQFRVRFHDKGGHNNNKTETVEVNYDLPVNNSDNEPLYCRAIDGTDIWPGLYEKAFAKWVTGNKSNDHPDLTQLHAGDPIKAMAQINGREPQYFECEKHSSRDLLGLVRAHCVNHKTINPMAAFTHATGNNYCGANVAANHAYSVLGYCILGPKQYIVLRNPWGITEPEGITSYDGLLGHLEPENWSPSVLLNHGGLFALDSESFKQAFSYIGIAE
jgi:hypothetical protein